MLSGVLNQISAQTTAGFSTAPVAVSPPLVFLLIVGMVVFSGAFSVLSLPRLVGLGRQPKNGQQRHA